LRLYRGQLRDAVARDLSRRRRRLVMPRQLAPRRRLIGLSAAAIAALAAAAVVVGSTLTAASAPSAYAAAKKALAATRAAPSGTMTASVSGGGSSYSLDTVRWNGDAVGLTRGQRSHLVPRYGALLLIGGGAYVQRANGSWLHYASVSALGKLGPAAQLAQDDVRGTTANHMLSLATGVTRRSRQDGTAVYTGTIPNSNADPGVAPTDDTILRIVSNLRSGHEPGAPGGYHGSLRLRMIVGGDGFLQQVSLTFEQQETGTPDGNGPTTWSVSYSHLGATPPITAPAASTPAG
jgi:hypothetical protein